MDVSGRNSAMPISAKGRHAHVRRSAIEDLAPGTAAILFLVVLGIVSLPLWLVVNPPLLDYMDHIARSAVLIHYRHSPFLQQIYHLNSFILPNIGMDGVLYVLGNILPVTLAGKVFIFLTLLMILGGTVLIHHAVYRRFSIWPLIAAALLHNAVLVLGFMNYLFGVGLALIALAVWIYSADWRSGWRLAAGCVFALLLFFAHMMGLAIYAIMVAAFELQRAWSRRRTGHWQVLRDLILSAAQFVPPLLLFALASPSSQRFRIAFDFRPSYKFYILYSWFMSGNATVDIITAGLLALCAVIALVGARIRIAPSLALVLVALCVAIVLTPVALFSLEYADSRIPMIVFFVGVASLSLSFANRTLERCFIASVAALLLIRSTVLAGDWISFDKTIGEFTTAFAGLPAESTLLVATPGPLHSLGLMGEFNWRPPIRRVASLAMLEKPVFIPSMWAESSQQPIVINPRFAAMKAFQTTTPLSIWSEVDLAAVIDRYRLLEAELYAQSEHRPEAYFLMINPNAPWQRHPPHGLAVATGSRFALFKIEPLTP